jgi:hypothetical protein
MHRGIGEYARNNALGQLAAALILFLHNFHRRADFDIAAFCSVHGLFTSQEWSFSNKSSGFFINILFLFA